MPPLRGFPGNYVTIFAGMENDEPNGRAGKTAVPCSGLKADEMYGVFPAVLFRLLGLHFPSPRVAALIHATRWL